MPGKIKKRKKREDEKRPYLPEINALLMKVISVVGRRNRAKLPLSPLLSETFGLGP